MKDASRATFALSLALVGAALAVPFAGRSCLSARAPQSVSIWDGVYTQDQASRGARTYAEACASCHGNTGLGTPLGPSIVGSALEEGWADQPLVSYYLVIRDQMPAGRPGSLQDQAVVDVFAHILALHGAPPGESELIPDEEALRQITFVTQPSSAPVRAQAAAEDRASILESFEAVTAETLADPAAADWPAYGRSAHNYRYSPLDQITVDNVHQLQLAWSRGMEEGRNQAAPLAYRGVIYLPNPHDVIQALDAETGELIWQHRRRHPMPTEDLMSMGDVIRGIALYDDKVYFVSWDNVVVALDARTGEVVWETERGDIEDGITNSTGPIVANGVVVAGSLCQFSGRGCYVTGHDAQTGEEVWRNNPIPRPGEPGDETWAGSPFEKRWMTGVWGQITYDAELDLVHYGSSGVGPASETQRGMPGATMWGTNTRFAVRPRTGEIVWSHQTLPRDNWDQECTFEMVPENLNLRPSPDMTGLQAISPSATGEGRRVLMGMPCKTGQIWVFDAETGEFLWARDTIEQDLVESIDEHGIVTVNEDKVLKNVGETVEHCPAHQGGRVWPPSSYNPVTHVMFFPLMNLCQRSTPRDNSPGPSNVYNLRESRMVTPGKENAGRLEAVHMETGETLWTWENYSVLYSPTMVTAGGVLFNGSVDRHFRAHDQSTGEVLWQTRLPAQVQGHPISYEVNGKQYIAVPAGGGAGPNNLRPTPGIDAITGSNALFVFALPGIE